MCGCTVYVKVITCIFYCVHLFYGTDVVMSVVYAKDSNSKWFYTWLAEFWRFSWFLVFSGICRYISDYMCVWEGAYIWGEILIPFNIWDGEYCDDVWVMFSC